jgi:hypothetical protein
MEAPDWWFETPKFGNGSVTSVEKDHELIRDQRNGRNTPLMVKI